VKPSFFGEVQSILYSRDFIEKLEQGGEALDLLSTSEHGKL
jgi:hypothetical protein